MTNWTGTFQYAHTACFYEVCSEFHRYHENHILLLEPWTLEENVFCYSLTKILDKERVADIQISKN